MDKKTARRQRPKDSGRQSFPDRTNPNRDPQSEQSDDLRSERGDHRYPEKCNPNNAKPPLDEDQKTLAVRYLPLARSMAQRMQDIFPDSGDEFHSVAFLALVEAAQHFDPSRGVNFSVFARYRIWGALCDMRNEMLKKSNPVGIGSGPVIVRLGNNTDFVVRVLGSTPEPPLGRELDALDTIENWIGQLPGLQAQAFRHIYLDGKSQAEAAELVGWSKWTMCRMHSQGLNALQRICQKDCANAPRPEEN